MSLLANLTTSDEIKGEQDRVGGGFQPLDTAIYKSTVTMAYLQKSSGGALGLNLVLTTDAGREVRQTLWMTSGDAKGNKNFFVDKNGDKQYLPGFNLANSLCQLTVGKEIAAMETESKVVQLYSPEAKAEVPTKVDMLMDLLGQEVYAAVLKQIEDKNAKGDDGKYYPTGETRETNEIDKFFCARDSHDKMTVMEITGGATEAVFYNTWDQKFTGTVRDKSKGVAGNAGAPKAGAPMAAAAASVAKPATSLFAQQG